MTENVWVFQRLNPPCLWTLLLFPCKACFKIHTSFNIAYKTEKVWVNCMCWFWVSVFELAVCFGRGWFLLSGSKLFCFCMERNSFLLLYELNRAVKKDGPSVSSNFSSHLFKDIPLLGSCVYYLAGFEEELSIPHSDVLPPNCLHSNLR